MKTFHPEAAVRAPSGFIDEELNRIQDNDLQVLYVRVHGTCGTGETRGREHVAIESPTAGSRQQVMQPHPRRSVDRLLAAAGAGVGLSAVLVVALAGLPAGAMLPVYPRDARDRSRADVVLVHPTGLIRNFRWSDGEWR